MSFKSFENCQYRYIKESTPISKFDQDYYPSIVWGKCLPGDCGGEFCQITGNYCSELDDIEVEDCPRLKKSNILSPMYDFDINHLLYQDSETKKYICETGEIFDQNDPDLTPLNLDLDILNYTKQLSLTIKQLNISSIIQSGIKIVNCLLNNNKVLICGNGGSAAMSQHLAAELVGRFQTERKSLPAISLTTDTSILTAIANDYDYSEIFIKQCKALLTKDDILICFSTSGNSNNVLKSMKYAKSINSEIILLTGNKLTDMHKLTKNNILVNSNITAIIQEVHLHICHMFCLLIDKIIVEK